LSLVQIKDPSQIKKSGHSLIEVPESAIVRGTAPQGGAPTPAAAGTQTAATSGAANSKNKSGDNFRSSLLKHPPRVFQGVLESSNVNPVQEMSKMIQAQRLYEQNAKMMQTFGNLQSSVSEIGKF
jgi:flagellar basal body rod protein FlgG